MAEEMQFDWAGLMKLLAENLYNKKQVFIRELVQNSTTRSSGLTYPEAGRIEIEVDLVTRRLCIADNGIGMNDADLRNYLSTVGIGATRLSGKSGLVGHFGIGFLSAFIVAERVEVVTRKEGETDSYRWKNTGSRQYTITKSQELGSSGTRVEVYVRSEEGRDPQPRRGGLGSRGVLRHAADPDHDQGGIAT
jgi:molecular chaperone HtpG